MTLDSILRIANAVAHSQPKRPKFIVVRHNGLKREIRFTMAVELAAKLTGVEPPKLNDGLAVCVVLRNAVRKLQKIRSAQNAQPVVAERTLDARKNSTVIAGLAGDYWRYLRNPKSGPVNPQAAKVFGGLFTKEYDCVLVDSRRDAAIIEYYLARRAMVHRVVVVDTAPALGLEQELDKAATEWSAPVVAYS